MSENKRFVMYGTKGYTYTVEDKENEMPLIRFTDEKQSKRFLNLLNEREDKLEAIENTVQNCNVYNDDLKQVIFEIRNIING